MDFSQLSNSLQRDAVWVVFLNVLLQQSGLPVPAVPTLLLAGSLAMASSDIVVLLAAAVLASVLADGMWYLAGRKYGYRLLSGLCRLSINPGSCVSQTEKRFVRWGPGSLLVAKFIPGFSTVAPPIAGSLRMAPQYFLLAAAFGAALWAGLALAAGAVLRGQVQTVMHLLELHASNAAAVIVGVLAVWLIWKVWQKSHFKRLAEIAHITTDELLSVADGHHAPRLLDLRSPSLIAETGHIQGAIIADVDRIPEAVHAWPKSTSIITLCACPEDAAAVQAAHTLLNAGYLSVRPLKGGYEAWRSAHALIAKTAACANESWRGGAVCTPIAVSPQFLRLVRSTSVVSGYAERPQSREV